MAINFDLKNKENRQKLMMWTLIAVLGITFFVLYNYFFQSQRVVPLFVENAPKPLLIVQESKLNTEILSSTTFQGLKKFGNYPVDVKDSDLGRENPFIPF